MPLAMVSRSMQAHNRSMTRAAGKGMAVMTHGARDTSPMAGTSAMSPLEGIGLPLTVGSQRNGAPPAPPGMDCPGSASMKAPASPAAPASKG